MTVELRALNEENWHMCIGLTVRTDQADFVASNVYSIAQSRFEPTLQLRAIYDNEQMVGFLMFDSADYFLVRLMIDQQHQGRGYGKAALQQLIEQFEKEYAHPFTSTSYVPENQVAGQLYANLGYRPTGEIDDGEIVVRRALRQTNSQIR